MYYLTRETFRRILTELKTPESKMLKIIASYYSYSDEVLLDSFKAYDKAGKQSLPYLNAIIKNKELERIQRINKEKRAYGTLPDEAS